MDRYSRSKETNWVLQYKGLLSKITTACFCLYMISFVLSISFAENITEGKVKINQINDLDSLKKIIAHPPIHIVPRQPGLARATPYGATPAMIRAAYGLPSTGGSGTIAIIDAYDDPTIQNDFNIFSQQYGLPTATSANFEVHKMASTMGNSTISGWDGEICLDVEWAHAIAPNAKILLVECITNNNSDLLNGVIYAASRPDVVAVSMSYGSNEFSSVSVYDQYFVSSYGAAFFASAGDNGTGVSWPAVSKNVIGVGGTNLYFNSLGQVTAELAWNGSGGGLSVYEREPSYQSTYGVPLTNGYRAVPDVSYNGGLNSYVSVYDSYSNGWIGSYGTSAGTPQWAAIKALGVNASNSNFYNLASKALTYSSNFRDIVSGTNGSCGNYCTATTGYDYVTGLGSPLGSGLLSSQINQSFVTNVLAQPSYGGINLYWKNPVRSDYSGTLIRVRTDRYPTDPNDGTLVYWYNGTSCNAAGTNGQKYYFGIFAHDTALNFFSSAFVSAIPNSYNNVQNVSESTPWSGAAQLSWSNPSGTNAYDATIIIRRKDRWPVDPADGFEADMSRWFVYWYNGTQTGEGSLNPDSTYYYGFYSNDTNMNFGPGVLAAHREKATLGNIRNLVSKPEYKSAYLSWVNPTTANYNATLVVRNSDHIPTSPTDGTIASWNNSSGFTDPNLMEGKKYYYTIYPNTPGMVFAPGISVAVIPGSYQNIAGLNANAGNGSVSVTWANPNRSDYQATLVIRRTDRMPIDPSDGTANLYWNNGTTYSDTGLTNGQTYYYAFYAQDKNGGFSPGNGIAVMPSASVSSLIDNNSYISSQMNLSVSSSIQPGYSGWYDALGNFKTENAAQFWVGDKDADWQNNTLILNGDNTNLTMKNLMVGGSYQVKVTYDSDQEVKITPVFLEYKDEGSNELINVTYPAQINTNKKDGKIVTVSELYGENGSSVQLQLIIQNPNKSVIKINSIQLIPITSLKTVSISSIQYAELM